MQNRNSEELFALVKGMSKSEKKNFTLYASRNSNSGDLKVLTLFQALNAMDKYDEKSLVRRMGGADYRGLGGLKAILYQQLLESLRLIQKEEQVEVQLHQLIDHANVLCGKGLPVQASKVLIRAKALAKRFHQTTFCYQVVMMQKRLELVHGSCDPDNIIDLTQELRAYSEELSLTSDLSNRAMLLYGYLKNFGLCVGGRLLENVEVIYNNAPGGVATSENYYVRLFFAQLQVYYFLLKGDHSSYYTAASSWLSLFQHFPEMRDVEAVTNYRALMHVNEAAYLNGDRKTADKTCELLALSADPFFCIAGALNQKLLQGAYDEPLLREAVAFVASDPEQERLLVVCEKAGRLCMQHKRDELAIDFANLGLNVRTSIRPDLQVSLRALHIASHERLGNVEVIEYLKRSANRFMNALSANDNYSGAKGLSTGGML
ncbi:MAG: hypothetical protein ACO1OO_04335 [Flavisolibacter sp.]